MELNLLKQELDDLIATVKSACISDVIEFSRAGRHVDNELTPNDSRTHYGESHLAAAILMADGECCSPDDVLLAKKLLGNLVSEWHFLSSKSDFHSDFNNFALCIASEQLDRNELLSQKIREILLQSEDSNHETVNWIPMRWYVNATRVKISDEQRFRKRAVECERKISRALNTDGGIEDQVPHGKSYNLQYNIATLAGLKILERVGISINISAQMVFLKEKILPDGDINYLGRGVNQVFAWGPWIYLLCVDGDVGSARRAISVLAEKVMQSLPKKNMFLNSWQGQDRLHWWDYHHFNVYISHLFLWLVVAREALVLDRGTVGARRLSGSSGKSTGLVVHERQGSGCVTFSGRSLYFSEQGPSVAALWLKDLGVVWKGSGGPVSGAFGRNYARDELARQLVFGPVSVSEQDLLRLDGSFLSLFERLYARIRHARCVTRIEVEDIDPKRITLAYHVVGPTVFKCSIFSSINKLVDIELHGDDKRVDLPLIGRIKGQYDWMDWMQSIKLDVGCYRLSVSVNDI